MTTITSGRRVLGTVSQTLTRTPPCDCEAVLTWELRETDGVLDFYASGQVWHGQKLIHGGPMVLDALAILFPGNLLLLRVRDMYRRHEYNNNREPGTREQMAFVRAMPIPPRKDHESIYAALRAANLLEIPVTDELRARERGIPDHMTVIRFGEETVGLNHVMPPSDVEAIKRFQEA